MSGRMFPVMGGREVGPGQIPWELILRHEPQALRNHSQTIERLAERGGLGWGEAHAVLKGYRMRAPYMNQAVARAEVEVMVAEWESNDDRNHIAYLEDEVRAACRLTQGTTHGIPPRARHNQMAGEQVSAVRAPLQTIGINGRRVPCDRIDVTISDGEVILRIVLVGYEPEHIDHMPETWRMVAYSARVATSTSVITSWIGSSRPAWPGSIPALKSWQLTVHCDDDLRNQALAQVLWEARIDNYETAIDFRQFTGKVVISDIDYRTGAGVCQLLGTGPLHFTDVITWDDLNQLCDERSGVPS